MRARLGLEAASRAAHRRGRYVLAVPYREHGGSRLIWRYLEVMPPVAIAAPPPVTP